MRLGSLHFPWVPSPSIDDKFEEPFAKKGKQAYTALSHLMKVMYLSRLCRGDVLTTTSFLARRVHYWSLNDDRRLHRLMAYIHHHTDLCLLHQLHLDDRSEAYLDFSPDAELGGGTPTPQKRRGDSGWNSPPLVGVENCPFPSGLKRPPTPVGQTQIQKHGV